MLPDIHALHAVYMTQMTQISLNTLHASACPRYPSMPCMLLHYPDIPQCTACCFMTQIFLLGLKTS